MLVRFGVPKNAIILPIFVSRPYKKLGMAKS
jgi:hypothetical protein